MRGRYAGQDLFSLVVSAFAKGRGMRMTLSGRCQADATAAGAAEIARILAARECDRPGVWLPEQVIQPEPFWEAMSRYGLQAVTQVQL